MKMPEMPAPMMIASNSVLLAARGCSKTASESFICSFLFRCHRPGPTLGRISYSAVFRTRSAEFATQLPNAPSARQMHYDSLLNRRGVCCAARGAEALCGLRFPNRQFGRNEHGYPEPTWLGMGPASAGDSGHRFRQTHGILER